ncbi:sensor histidine kinase [Effusibacillus consociatus]|uniref:histidine kinase n=1 Tax=Effusibacillus consociatus TaxID=1117041 RepID=A0ABV9Q529_9BACL
MKTRVLRSWTNWLGIGLILLGIWIPNWLGPEQMGLNDLLHKMEREPTGNSIVVTTFILVALKTIRGLPFYLGAFLLGDRIGDLLERPWLRIAIPLVTVPLLYFTVDPYNPLNYDLGSSTLLLLFAIYLLQRLGTGRLGPAMKSLVLSQLFIGLQWLDVVPFLSSYGFGRGPISSELKELAIRIGFDQALGLYGIVLCLIFVIHAVVLAVFLAMAAQKWMITQTLHLAQLEAMESRAGREVLHLVHDLKTPLATIEGLISLVDMRLHDSKIKEYCQIISASIMSMSEMISEILYEDRKSWCLLEDLINYVRASRLSGTKACLELEFRVDRNIRVWINKIRITRALVNLIDNAFDALENKNDGKVVLRVEMHGSEVWLGVSDNGPGITSLERDKVWQAGYSTKHHPGVGLSFVRQVAEGHGGSVAIDSEVGRGTTVWVKLPGGGYSE